MGLIEKFLFARKKVQKLSQSLLKSLVSMYSQCKHILNVLFRPSTNIIDVVVSNNIMVVALEGNHIQRIDINHPSEIDSMFYCSFR